MKILAWLMFATSVACFVVVFCRQQVENKLADNVALLSLPSPQWSQLAKQQRDEGWDEALEPATQPAPAHSAVAASDLGDAIK